MELTRDAMLALPPATATVERVEVPALGGHVYVRALSGAERDAMDSERNRGGIVAFRAWYAVRVICNEAGERLFTDADAAALAQKPAHLLDPAIKAALRLNGQGTDADEELEGNSNGPSGASGSA